jgi:TolB-like protein/DNA-binding winged helix-turn-helix (wHTH) protein
MQAGKTDQLQGKSESFRLGDWTVEPDTDQIRCGGESIKLEPKVMDVLAYLASRQGEVVSREELERDVWHGALVGYDSVTSTIIKLRKALSDQARNPKYIATVPKRGYRLIMSVQTIDAGKAAAFSTQTATEPVSRSTFMSMRNPIAMIVVAAVVLAGLVLFVRFPSEEDVKQPGSVPRPPQHSIIVLPFENLSDDPKQAIFANGVTEDLITDLARLSNLRVIASNTAFSYQGRKVDPQEVGAELGVEFVLASSIRRSGDAIRVNTQLVETESGFQRWASRYDRRLDEVFAVQDELVNNIVSALAVELTAQEKQRLARRATHNLIAYDWFLEGQRLSRISTKETNEQSQSAYRQAIQADPSYGRAYGALAVNLAFNFRRGWTDSPLETTDRALNLAKQGVELDGTIPQTYWSLGYVHLMRKEFADAEKAARQSIQIAPNYADGFGLLALIYNNLGQAQAALDHITKGMQLNPYFTWDYPYNQGRAYYTLGRYEEAIESLSRALERNENAVPPRLWLAASYVRSNALDDAEWEIEQLLVTNPKTTLTHTKNAMPIQNPQLMQSFLDDLRAAGLPE